jgi:hypothetical protein
VQSCARLSASMELVMRLKMGVAAQAGSPALAFAFPREPALACRSCAAAVGFGGAGSTIASILSCDSPYLRLT